MFKNAFVLGLVGLSLFGCATDSTGRIPAQAGDVRIHKTPLVRPYQGQVILDSVKFKTIDRKFGQQIGEKKKEDAEGFLSKNVEVITAQVAAYLNSQNLAAKEFYFDASSVELQRVDVTYNPDVNKELNSNWAKLKTYVLTDEGKMCSVDYKAIFSNGIISRENMQSVTATCQ